MKRMRFLLVYIILVITLLIIAISSVSCTHDNPNRMGNHSTNENIPWEYVTEFNYKGHDYIKFSEGFEYKGYAGVVHNPECKKCLEMYE